MGGWHGCRRGRCSSGPVFIALFPVLGGAEMLCSSLIIHTVGPVLNASLYYLRIASLYPVCNNGTQELCDAINSEYTVGTHGHVRVRV